MYIVTPEAAKNKGKGEGNSAIEDDEYGKNSAAGSR